MWEHESAMLVPPDDPEALADAIERLCEGTVRQLIANGGRAAYARFADASARAQMIGEVVERVMGDRWQRPPTRD